MSIEIVLYVLAAITFLLAALPRVVIQEINLVPLGLLFLTLGIMSTNGIF